MKIWITRDIAGSIMAGGLERLHVWFRKPTYVGYLWTPEWEAQQFIGYYPPTKGVKFYQWRVMSDDSFGVQVNFSFGKVFGYMDGKDSELNLIAGYIWSMLKSHFHNKPFLEWERLELDGKSKVEDFLLQIELDISLRDK